MIFRKIYKKLDEIIRRLGVLIGQVDDLLTRPSKNNRSLPI